MASRPDYQFGDFAGGHNVDLVLYNLIDKWLLTYLYEIARRSGEEFDELKPFRSWRVSTELEKMPEDQTPALIMVNLGLADNPVKRGSSSPGQSFYATWSYQFGCLTSAKGKKVNAAPRAIRLSQMYTTAVRLILIQKSDDEGVLGMRDWMDEGYDGVDSEDDRTINLSHTDFWINVPAAATWANGPMEPVPEPGPDSPVWPTVISADVGIEKVPLDEPFPEPEPPPVPIPSWEYNWGFGSPPAVGEMLVDDPDFITQLHVHREDKAGADISDTLLATPIGAKLTVVNDDDDSIWLIATVDTWEPVMVDDQYVLFPIVVNDKGGDMIAGPVTLTIEEVTA
jgi:hypothetical protein